MALSAAVGAAVVPLGVGGATAAAAGTAGTLTAVVSLAGSAAVSAPGVHVVAALPHVRAEVVRGSAAALAGLRTRPGVLGVAPNRAVHLASRSYGHDENGDGNGRGKGKGQDGGSQDVLASTVVGDDTTGDGAGVNVAVIDTGISDTKVLSRDGGRLVDGVDTSGLVNPGHWDPVVEGGSGQEFTDGFGHGTYVASIIAGGDGVGVAPKANVYVVKVANDHGETSLAAVIAGLDWVANSHHGIDVANLSLSADQPFDSGYGVDPLNWAVEQTVGNGVTVVAASGNTAGVVSDPGSDPLALTVGAVDTTLASGPAVADFSGSGNVDGVAKPEVVAAGVHLLGAVADKSFVARTNKKAVRSSGHGVDLIPGSGTSGAAAVVAGLAAAYVGDHGGASPAEVKASLADGATDLGGARFAQYTAATAPTADVTAVDALDNSVVNSDAWRATAALWPAELWADLGMDTRSWSTRSWSTRSWSTRSWSTRSWSTRSWSTRSWSTRSWSTRSWSTRSWSTRSWSVASWGD